MKLDTPIHHLMTRNPRTVSVTDELSDVWTEMLNGGFHHVPVLEDGRLVGILSVADLRVALRDLPEDIYETGVILSEGLTIRNLMTPDPEMLPAGSTVRDAAECFTNGRYHCLPIVEGGEVVGIVTTTDLVRWMLTQG